MILDGYKSASYKGQEFLVQDGSVEFGQKNVVHKFPNSNRNEVEWLGKDAEIFSLTLVIHATEYLDYVTKRSNLKRLLGEPKAGALIHPFEGVIDCAVVGKPSVSDDFNNLGICTFTVTFQKYDAPIYPTQSESNFQNVGSLADRLRDGVKGVTERLYSVSNALSFDSAFDTLGEYSALFKDAINAGSKVANLGNVANSFVNTFETNIASITNSASQLGDTFESSYDSLDFLGDDNEEQLAILKTFNSFEYDSGLEELSDSYNAREQINNNRIIVNAVRINALALQYKTVSTEEFTNSEQVDSFQGDLETQFNDLITSLSLDYDIEYLLIQLNTEMNKLFKSVRDRVADIEVVSIQSNTNITNLSYAYYGTTDKAEELLDLNQLISANFIQGETKVLTDVDT